MNHKSIRAIALCTIVILAMGAGPALSAVRYVKINSAKPTAPYTSWGTASNTVQAAIKAAASGDEVWVAAGTYRERLVLQNGVSVYGGFAGNEAARGLRDWRANVCEISGEGVRPKLIGVDARALSTPTAFDGFTISGWTYTGIRCSGNADISHNTITDLTGQGITAISCQGSGYTGPGAPLIRDNLIADIRGAYYGMGISCQNCPATITNNTISGITATTHGSWGIYIVSDEVGGLSIANNVVTFNGYGGIVMTYLSIPPTLRHNCVYGNRVNYELIPDPTGTNGNVSANPMFVDAAGGDYRLTLESPCVDRGYDDIVESDKDIDGNDRKIDIPTVIGSLVDIGAYEYADSAAPSRPVVTDDGANQLSADSLHATWTCSDSGGAIVAYEYAIGTSPTFDAGDRLVVDWTPAGTHTGATQTNLNLREDESLKYYFYVRAQNAVGLWSNVGVSGGVRVTGLVDKDYLLGNGDFEDCHLIRWYAAIGGSDFADHSIYVAPSGTDGYMRPENTDKKVADGWGLVATGTSTPYANTICRIDDTNRFGYRYGKCQYMALTGDSSSPRATRLSYNYPIDASKPFGLRPGDTVTFTIDRIAMSDYLGADVAYSMNLSYDLPDVPLTPSATAFSYSTPPFVIKDGTTRLDPQIRIHTTGSLGGHSPGIYIDGAHLTVRHAGDTANGQWAVPVKPVRNIRTHNVSFSNYTKGYYAAVRDYDSLTQGDSEWSYLSKLRKLDPDGEVFVYKSGATALDVRDVIPGGSDVPFKPCGVSFWELTDSDGVNDHPEWLFSDGSGGYIETSYDGRYPLRVEDTAYQDFWAAEVSGVGDNLGYDGVWIDDMGVDVDSTVLQAQDHAQEFMHGICPSVKASGLTVVQNSASRHLGLVGSAPDWDGGYGRIYFDPFWVPSASFPGFSANEPDSVADVFFQEYSFFDSDQAANGFNRSEWLRCLDDMDVLAEWNTELAGGVPRLAEHQKRRIHMWTIGNDVADEPSFGLDGWISFSLCSYLLGQNDWTSFGISVRRGGYTEYPNLDYSVTKLLGVPDGVRTAVDGSSYCQYRTYESSGAGEAGGVVVANADYNAVSHTGTYHNYTVPFDADMADLRDGATLFTYVPANTVLSLPPNTGRILLNHQAP